MYRFPISAFEMKGDGFELPFEASPIFTVGAAAAAHWCDQRLFSFLSFPFPFFGGHRHSSRTARPSDATILVRHIAKSAFFLGTRPRGQI